MNKSLVLSLFLSFLVSACSESTTTTKAPTPTDPNSAPIVNLPVTTPPTDSRIPDLTNTVAVRLVDSQNYFGLQDFAETVFAPLVGDVRTRLSITGGRERTVTGKLVLSFEDKEGLFYAEIPSFDSSGYRDSSNLDMIFADSSMVVRVLGTINSDNLNGTIFYRKRVSGELACTPQRTICEQIFSNSWNWPIVVDPSFCSAPQDVVSPCRVYVTPSGFGTKQLGTFTGSLSTWTVR